MGSMSAVKGLDKSKEEPPFFVDDFAVPVGDLLRDRENLLKNGII
jgi:hypothetical protein